MNSGRILIVDDSENIRNVLQLNFEYLGYQVATARDGDEALAMIRKDPPDLVILDVMMPGQNGFQVCRKLKLDSEYARIPVLFLTAKGQSEDRYWGKDCGADEYLTKPFSTAEVERVVERLMSRRSKGLTAWEFEREIEARRRDGNPCAVMTVRLDPKAKTIFRQKYGEPRFHEALEGIRQTMEVILQEETGESLVWMTGDAILMTILPGEEERARALCDRITMQSNILLKSLYESRDAEQGFVVARQGADAHAVHVPLLSLEASVTFGEE